MKLFVVKNRKNGLIVSEHPSKQEAKAERDKLNGKKPEQITGKPMELLDHFISKGSDHWLFGRKVHVQRKSNKKRVRLPHAM